MKQTVQFFISTIKIRHNSYTFQIDDFLIIFVAKTLLLLTFYRWTKMENGGRREWVQLKLKMVKLFTFRPCLFTFYPSLLFLFMEFVQYNFAFYLVRVCARCSQRFPFFSGEKNFSTSEIVMESLTFSFAQITCKFIHSEQCK